MLRPIATAQPGCGWRRSMPLSMPMSLIRPIRTSGSPTCAARPSSRAMCWHSAALPRLAADEDQPVDRLVRERRLRSSGGTGPALRPACQRLAARLLDLPGLLAVSSVVDGAVASATAVRRRGGRRRPAAWLAVAATSACSPAPSSANAVLDRLRLGAAAATRLRLAASRGSRRRRAPAAQLDPQQLRVVEARSSAPSATARLKWSPPTGIVAGEQDLLAARDERPRRRRTRCRRSSCVALRVGLAAVDRARSSRPAPWARRSCRPRRASPWRRRRGAG